MRFRFSVKSLFILTTAVSVLMGIAVWLQWISHWRLVAALACYMLVYLLIVSTFYGPRYLREFIEFREKRNHQRLVRASLEHEAAELLKMTKSKSKANSNQGDQDNQQETQEFEN